jgi:LysW-gamma-L-alpha-aminoadipyl-6-phosphate/LysW-L-glutamyl-5-phosphate reductase
LLRLLLGHPEVEVAGAVSSRFTGKRVDGVHPNLRSATDLSFCAAEAVPEEPVRISV